MVLWGLLALCALVACKATEAPTLEPAATATVPKATATLAQKSVPTATLAAASKPGATPTPPWQIPELQESDWVKGGVNAGLVLVEYSDYQ
jgi:hypothetical protein